MPLDALLDAVRRTVALTGAEGSAESAWKVRCATPGNAVFPTARIIAEGPTGAEALAAPAANLAVSVAKENVFPFASMSVKVCSVGRGNAEGGVHRPVAATTQVKCVWKASVTMTVLAYRRT